MIPIFEPHFAGNESRYLSDCIETGWISSQGKFITDFEAAFAARHAMPHGVATSNCTTALHLALLALDIGPGDEVLCPDLTFIAPANMIKLTGAKAVLVDVEQDTWAIDPRDMARRITEKTKAVIVVHPFGHAADMDPILELAKEHGLKVVEDVAEAPGGAYKGKALGTLGDASCYSFFANKVITSGEGGIVMARDAELDEKLRVLRDHGMSRSRRYVHEVAGFNYRMTNMQAAVALAQLEKFDEILTRRAEQDAQYRTRFAASDKAAYRPFAEWCAPVHWMSTITLRDENLRDPLLDHMKTRGIDCRQMIFPVHFAAPFQDENDRDDFPVTRSISLRSLHLPSSTALEADTVDRICDTVLEWLEANDA